jgi:hypothetical protein
MIVFVLLTILGVGLDGHRRHATHDAVAETKAEDGPHGDS